MDIFENLENLNVSEECFSDIMDMVEGLVKVLAPHLAGKSKDGKKESVGTQIDRASVKHPLIYKAASTIDKTFAKRKSTTDSRTPDEKLKNIKPAGTIYGKDMYSSGQLKSAGYKNEASEERFSDIISIIEELISERNQENRQKKKDWETRKVPETSPFYSDSKEFRLKGREATIKGLKKHSNDKGSFLIQDAIDKIAQGSRADLGREQNPVSFTKPSEWNKDHSKELRKEQSQRGSTKDNMAFDEDDLKTKHSVIKSKLDKTEK